MNDLVVMQTAQVKKLRYPDVVGNMSVSSRFIRRRSQNTWSCRGVFDVFIKLTCRYDHRSCGDLSSKSFFDITVKVFGEKGVKVYGFNQFAFTPLVVSSRSVLIITLIMMIFSFLLFYDIAICNFILQLLCRNYDYGFS